MHYANGFLLCRPFLRRDDERTHYKLLNEQAAARIYIYIYTVYIYFFFLSVALLVKILNCLLKY